MYSKKMSMVIGFHGCDISVRDAVIMVRSLFQVVIAMTGSDMEFTFGNLIHREHLSLR